MHFKWQELLKNHNWHRNEEKRYLTSRNGGEPFFLKKTYVLFREFFTLNENQIYVCLQCSCLEQSGLGALSYVSFIPGSFFCLHSPTCLEEDCLWERNWSQGKKYNFYITYYLILLILRIEKRSPATLIVTFDVTFIFAQTYLLNAFLQKATMMIQLNSI